MTRTPGQYKGALVREFYAAYGVEEVKSPGKFVERWKPNSRLGDLRCSDEHLNSNDLSDIT